MDQKLDNLFHFILSHANFVESIDGAHKRVVINADFGISNEQFDVLRNYMIPDCERCGKKHTPSHLCDTPCSICGHAGHEHMLLRTKDTDWTWQCFMCPDGEFKNHEFVSPLPED